MRAPIGDVFNLAEIENLLSLEWRSVIAAPVAVPVGTGISFSPTPRLGRPLISGNHSMSHLHLVNDDLAGDMTCSLHALPIEKDSVQLIVVRHVFDVIGPHEEFEAELMRVLAPGGVLFLFGFNPASTWRLWWLQQALQGFRAPRWNSPAAIRQRLGSIDDMQSLQGYLGGSWPSIVVSDHRDSGRRWHGAWSLIARKQRMAARPVDPPLSRKRVVLAPGLARMPSRRFGL